MKRAFSLFEVMVAIIILLMLAGTVYTFMWNLMDDRQRAGERAARSVGATRFISLLEADLLTCIARTDTGRAGVAGSAEKLSLSSRHVQLGANGIGDVRDSVYEFDVGSGELRASRGGTQTEPIVAGISRVRFRYLVQREWQTTFDSQAEGALPRAVEVAIWFGKKQETEVDKGTGAVSTAEPASSATEEIANSDEEILSPPNRLAIIAIPDGGEDAETDESEAAP